MGISLLFVLTILLSYVNQVHLQMFHPRDISRGQDQQQVKLRNKYLIQILNNIFNRAENIAEKRKRSCNFNLGFHCQTDEYSSIADMYDYLQSSLSPGKRKRTMKMLSIARSKR